MILKLQEYLQEQIDRLQIDFDKLYEDLGDSNQYKGSTMWDTAFLGGRIEALSQLVDLVKEFDVESHDESLILGFEQQLDEEEDIDATDLEIPDVVKIRIQGKAVQYAWEVGGADDYCNEFRRLVQEYIRLVKEATDG